MVIAVAVTRNKSISACTLQTLMELEIICIKKGERLEILFTDSPLTMSKAVKKHERLLWLDFSVAIDTKSLLSVFEPFPQGYHVMVFPVVVEGVDWKMFEKKTREGSTELVSQRGLNFDTVVGRVLAPGIRDVTSTTARGFLMDCKQVDKKLRTPKMTIKLSDSYEENVSILKDAGVKFCALTSAVVTASYTHECFGNILDVQGVTFKS